MRVSRSARLKMVAAAAAGIAATGLAAAPPPRPFLLIPGGVPADGQPDGNTVILDAPQGLIVFDTGRHPGQQDKILAAARSRGKPIAAIVNSHWHLDHSGGNAAIRAAFPRAAVYASTAIEGALRGFFPKSRSDAERYLASGKGTPGQAEDIRRDIRRIAQPDALRPTRPVLRSAPMMIAGRSLDVHLAPFAATEGDVWIFDRRENVVLAGDLVVDIAPFFDTGCPDGWRRALDEIAAIPFARLVPGHGFVMTRPQFLQWRRAFDNLLDCAGSTAPRDACIAGWQRDAAAFIPAGMERSARGFIVYYLDSRLRAPPAERTRYCRPM